MASTLPGVDLERVRNFAIEAHGDQMYGDRPYSYHLDQVRDLIKALGYDEHTQAAGFLHDVPEDTNKTKREIITGTRIIKPVYDMIIAVKSLPSDTKDIKLGRAINHPGGHVVKHCDGCINLANSTDTTVEMSIEKRLWRINRYTGYVAVTRINLPSPEDVLSFLNNWWVNSGQYE